MRLARGASISPSWEIRGCLPKDLIGSAKLAIPSLETLDPGLLFTRDATTTARIDYALPNPLAIRVSRTANLLRDRADRLLLGAVLRLVLQNDPYRSLADLLGNPASACHDSILTRNGASGSPRGGSYSHLMWGSIPRVIYSTPKNQ